MFNKIKAEDVVDLKQAQKIIENYGSPVYVYNRGLLLSKLDHLISSLPASFTLSFAMKANTNPHILQLLLKHGVSHVDAVSPGQIIRALRCGFQSKHIMFTENFATKAEIEWAVEKNININIGALDTLKQNHQILKGKQIFIRVNPKLGAGENEHVITGGTDSKFGIYDANLQQTLQFCQKNSIKIVGLHQHIGSNLAQKDIPLFFQTTKYIFSLLETFPDVHTINVGGGLGVRYRQKDQITQPKEIYQQIQLLRAEWGQKLNRKLSINVEPGRYIIADSSVLLCRVTAKKSTPTKNFIGTDTGFNHLIRPALYGAHHNIINLSNPSLNQAQITNICGNICESTDFLAQNIKLQAKLGDILSIQNAGAYGIVMSSNYNERVRPAEVIVGEKGSNDITLIRRREDWKDLQTTFVEWEPVAIDQ